MRKTTIIPVLLLALVSLGGLSGCNTTTAKSSMPELTVDTTELKAMSGGRIGEALAGPAQPKTAHIANTQTERTGSLTRQYQDWKRRQRS